MSTLGFPQPSLYRARHLQASNKNPFAVFHPAVWATAGFAVLLHFAFNAQYGYFRDELYYAACGQHLAWGYVDHAPLAPFLVRVTRWALGDSLRAIRVLPALSGSAQVLIAAWLVREMRGKAFAQILAAIAVMLAPIYLTFDNFFSMNAFEPVFWMLAAGIILHICNGGDRRWWLVCGVVVGLGILNKHSMLFFASGLLLGMLLTSARVHLSNRWVGLGFLIAVLLFLPNLIWEIRHGFPTIALLRAVQGTKYANIPPFDYILQQSLLTGPISTPIWLSGLWYLLKDKTGRQYKFLALSYLVVLIEMLVLHGKIYYLAPAYIMLFAGGAVCIEARVALRHRLRWLSWIGAPLVVGAALALPLAVPVLSLPSAIKYSRFWDVQAVRVENMPQGALPQLFSDMMGWQQQVAAVASVYGTLTASEREVACVLTYNWGEASAVDYFGWRYGLPSAISGHNQYGLWGPRRCAGELVIALGFSHAKLDHFFQEVTPVAAVSPPYAMPEESRLTIYICRKPRNSLASSWKQLTYYD